MNLRELRELAENPGFPGAWHLSRAQTIALCGLVDSLHAALLQTADWIDRTDPQGFVDAKQAVTALRLVDSFGSVPPETQP